jgi:hypothetical protein
MDADTMFMNVREMYESSVKIILTNSVLNTFDYIVIKIFRVNEIHPNNCHSFQSQFMNSFNGITRLYIQRIPIWPHTKEKINYQSKEASS